MSEPVKILIVGPSWVGDMVMAQSLLIRLTEQHPGVILDVLAPPWSLGLLARMPQVSKAIAMPVGHGQLGLRQRWQLGKQLRSAHYTQAIVLPNSWKSALIPWFAGIAKRTGFVGEARWGLLNEARALHKQQLPMTVQRFVALADPKLPPDCPSPRLHISAVQQQQVSTHFALKVNTPVLALCPGAEYGLAKQWPARYFAQVAIHGLNQGHSVWLLGSSKDKPIAEEINTLTANACTNLVGQTDLTEAIDLLSLASAVVSNDSGLMHVAAALDKPVIALYGSSDPHFTPPLSPKAKILSLNLPCAPCFKRVCPLQHQNCLNQLMPEKVIAALEQH